MFTLWGQKNKWQNKNVQVLYQASFSVKFIPVQLVKENYMTEPRVRVGGTIKLTGQRVLIPEYH